MMNADPDAITVCTLDVVVMPNGEIICRGQSIGFRDKFAQWLNVKPAGSRDREGSPMLEAPSRGPWEAIIDARRSSPGGRMALVRTSDKTKAIDLTGSGLTFAQDVANAVLTSSVPDLFDVVGEIVGRFNGEGRMTEIELRTAALNAYIKATTPPARLPEPVKRRRRRARS